MKDETRQYVRAYVVGVVTVIMVGLAVILPLLLETRETLTATGTVRVENALGDAIVIEDMRSGRQPTRIKSLLDCSFQFGLADYVDRMSLTTFRIVRSDGQWAELQSNVFIDHRARAQEHGVEILSFDGRPSRIFPSPVEWESDNVIR